MRTDSAVTVLIFALALAGCLSGELGKAAEPKNPYDGLTCQQTLDKMTAELNAPLAKAAADSDTTADTIQKPVRIKSYPPVAGLGPANSGFEVAVNPHGDSSVYVSPDSGRVTWIPPVGYDSSSPVPISNSNPETTGPQTLPSKISAVQMLSTGAYRADVEIYDYANRLIRTFHQSFGYNGELSNPARSTSRGLVSYLVWDLKDENGNAVEPGVYTWKISFTFDNGLTEQRTIKTGNLGDRCDGLQ